MSYSARQWRAIKHYLKVKNLRPELSAFPVVRGTNRDTGVVETATITEIEILYDGHLASERHKRDDERRAARKAER